MAKSNNTKDEASTEFDLELTICSSCSLIMIRKHHNSGSIFK